jgi:hypothetical protein
MSRRPQKLACRKSTKPQRKPQYRHRGQVTGEQVCFPLAEQAALLLRQTEGRKDKLGYPQSSARYCSAI